MAVKPPRGPKPAKNAELLKGPSKELNQMTTAFVML